MLVVLLDDVGQDALEPWGRSARTARTPSVDCLCAAGVRFTQAWSSPMCSPSRAELLTGRYDRRSGIGEILTPAHTPTALPAREETLGELALRAGLRTGFVGKWHLASAALPRATTHPGRSGFERFAGTLGNLSSSAEAHGRPLDDQVWEKVVDGEVGLSRRYPTSDAVDEALDFARRADGPWLLVVAFHAAHEPFHSPPARLVEDRPPPDAPPTRLHRAMVEAADHELSRLLRGLPSEDLASTTVILASDNGSPAAAIPRDLPPDRHKGTFYEAGIRIPLVVAGPSVGEPGAASDALVHLVDVLPTVADLLGVEPAANLLDGRTLRPLLEAPDGPPIHDEVASFLFEVGPDGDQRRHRRALRDATHKLVVDELDQPSLFEVGPEALDEGPDLLSGSPGPEALETAEALWARLGALEASFPQ